MMHVTRRENKSSVLYSFRKDHVTYLYFCNKRVGTKTHITTWEAAYFSYLVDYLHNL